MECSFEIQDKMLKPEVLSYICENHLFEYCSFVTDDTMADVLYEQGHLNTVVQKAIEMGFPKEPGDLLRDLYTVSENAFL